MSVLVGGTTMLTILAAPLLTRLYTPEDFGLLAVYAGLLALAGVVSSLRYELAIPLPKDDLDAANVAVLSLLLVGAYTVFNYWAVRTKSFTTITGTRLSQALATIAVQLVAFKAGGLALLFGRVAGQSVGKAHLGRHALTTPAFKQVTQSGSGRAVENLIQIEVTLTDYQARHILVWSTQDASHEICCAHIAFS